MQKLQGACIQWVHGGAGAGTCKDAYGGAQEVVFPAQAEHESFESPPGIPDILLPAGSQGLPQLEVERGDPRGTLMRMWPGESCWSSHLRAVFIELVMLS